MCDKKKTQNKTKKKFQIKEPKKVSSSISQIFRNFFIDFIHISLEISWNKKRSGPCHRLLSRHRTRLSKLQFMSCEVKPWLCSQVSIIGIQIKLTLILPILYKIYYTDVENNKHWGALLPMHYTLKWIWSSIILQIFVTLNTRFKKKRITGIKKKDLSINC